MKAIHQSFPAGRVQDRIGDRRRHSAVAFVFRREPRMGCLCRCLLDRQRSCSAILEHRFGIAHVGQVSGARTGTEVAKKLVMAGSPDLRDSLGIRYR